MQWQLVHLPIGRWVMHMHSDKTYMFEKQTCKAYHLLCADQTNVLGLDYRWVWKLPCTCSWRVRAWCWKMFRSCVPTEAFMYSRRLVGNMCYPRCWWKLTIFSTLCSFVHGERKCGKLRNQRQVRSRTPFNPILGENG